MRAFFKNKVAMYVLIQPSVEFFLPCWTRRYALTNVNQYPCNGGVFPSHPCLVTRVY